MAYDPHKHHRRSIRLKNYDYSQPGAYFITICVEDRRCLFGEISDSEMKVNPLGEIVEQSWNSIPNKYQNVEMDEFVVMPNHFHGIIIINENPNPNVGAMLHRPVSHPDDEPVSVGATQGRPYKVTLGRIVAFFKYQSTKRMNEINDSPGSRIWQRNYYEHVVRNEDELNRIRAYISNNPAMWHSDEDNPSP